jgi:sugar phosphate isomerase/epimerase
LDYIWDLLRVGPEHVGENFVKEAYSRRQWMTGATVLVGTSLTAKVVANQPAEEKDRSKDEPFGFCLNTSTIDGQKLTIVEKIEIAAKAGYQAIEPWIREMDQHVKDGGNLKDLGKRIHDSGLSVPSAIGFAEWIVDDDTKRKKGLEEAKRDMAMVQQIGGLRLAAPPAGATQQTDLNLSKAAERYHKILELGDQMGLQVELELWGFSKALSRLGEVAFVAIESGHPKACILLDIYHLYKGGSEFSGLKFLSGSVLPVIHFNDYPAEPPRASIADAQRVYPGDGVAPLKEILLDLRAIGFRGFLSLELFNREYWKQDPLQVARIGLEKMKAAVKNSST